MDKSFLGNTRQAEWPWHKGKEGSTPQEAKEEIKAMDGANTFWIPGSVFPKGFTWKCTC